MAVTIVGAGVIGLTVAYYIKKLDSSVQVEVLAREMPKRKQDAGDEWTRGQWASPWAGAIFQPTTDASAAEKELQKESFRHFWRLAHEDPSTGIEVRMMRQYYDETVVPSSAHKQDKIWASDFLFKYRDLAEDELPQPRRGITGGAEFQSLCVNPWVYLPWLRDELQSMGVTFVHTQVDSLEALPGQVIVNATGLGAEKLANDPLVDGVRGQTMWVRSTYQGPMAIRTGKEYTYVIPRAYSRGVILGGVSDHAQTSLEPDEDMKHSIVERTSDLCPTAVSNARAQGHEPSLRDFGGLKVISDIVALRPGRRSGARMQVQVQRQRDGDKNILHAYGFEGAGYIFSGGVGRSMAAQALQIIHNVSQNGNGQCKSKL